MGPYTEDEEIRESGSVAPQMEGVTRNCVSCQVVLLVVVVAVRVTEVYVWHVPVSADDLILMFAFCMACLWEDDEPRWVSKLTHVSTSYWPSGGGFFLLCVRDSVVWLPDYYLPWFSFSVTSTLLPSLILSFGYECNRCEIPISLRHISSSSSSSTSSSSFRLFNFDFWFIFHFPFFYILNSFPHE